MPSTFQAVAVVVVALLPGALYVWAFERQAGRWGVALSDRLLRFVGGSAIFHALVAPATYWVWSSTWPAVRSGEPVSPWLWPLVVVYVVVPLLAGSLVGWGTRHGRAWSRWFTGPNPAPRAWDHLFKQGSNGWMRLRLKSGVWIGGAYATVDGRTSYVARYPEVQDLYLAAAVDVDPRTGEFRKDDDGDVVVSDSGILLRWDEVEYLQFIDT